MERKLLFTTQLGDDDLPEEVGASRVGRSGFDGDGGGLGSEPVAGDFELGESVNREVELGGVADRVVGRQRDEQRKDEEEPVGQSVDQVLEFLHGFGSRWLH